MENTHPVVSIGKYRELAGFGSFPETEGSATAATEQTQGPAIAAVMAAEAVLPTGNHDSAAQKRVVKVLASAQVMGGIGVAAGAAVGALLAADLASDSFSGVASSAS